MLAYAEALAFLVIMMSAIGQQASALNFLQYLRQMMEKTESQDLSIELWFKYAIGWYRDVFESDPWQTLVAYEDGLSRAELIGSRRMIGNTKFNAGLAELRLGELAHGEQRVHDFVETFAVQLLRILKAV